MARVIVGLCLAGMALALIAQAVLSAGAANTGLTAVGAALFMLVAAFVLLGSGRTQM